MKWIIVAAVLVPTVAAAERPSKPAIVELTIDRMLDKIQTTYMPGLRRCYAKALTVDPSLSGRVSAMFTVNPNGQVSGSVSGVAPPLEACLTSQLGRWRFPSPLNRNGARAEATFRISLALQP